MAPGDWGSNLSVEIVTISVEIVASMLTLDSTPVEQIMQVLLWDAENSSFWLTCNFIAAAQGTGPWVKTAPTVYL